MGKLLSFDTIMNAILALKTYRIFKTQDITKLYHYFVKVSVSKTRS